MPTNLHIELKLIREIPMKERYDALLAKIRDRKDAVNRFTNMLHTETTWLTSPASTKYHLNKEGGLLEHSIGVAETLLKLRTAIAPGIYSSITLFR